jgi:Ca2+-binding EF-hand superfamily protein
MKTFAAISLAALTLAAPALAQDMPGMQGGPGGPGMMFEQFDTNGDGSVTLEEVTAFQDARFAKADTNGDGKLDQAEMVAQAEAMQAEMLARMAERMKAEAPKRVAHMMIELDTDSDGLLSPEEAAAMGMGKGMETIFVKLDADGDGTVTLEEAQAFRPERGGRGMDHDRGPGQGWFGGFWGNGHR